MNLSPCDHFRARLEEALRGRASTGGTAAAWSTHLTDCADCRELLAAERALEGLLASLPAPHLPPHLAARVLARLDQVRRHREHGLDRLLALDGGAQAPPRLAARVLAGLAVERGPRKVTLDQLLDSVPSPAVPADLPARLLANLALERRPRLRLLRGGRTLRAAALAAGLLGAALLGWHWTKDDPAAPDETVAQNPRVPELADEWELSEEEELLAYAVERWDLLESEDIDLLLGSGLSPDDVALFELGDFRATTTGTAPVGPEGEAR